VHLLEDLVAYLTGYWRMPAIEDPSCPGTTFNHRWTESKYANFKAQIERYAGWAREALDEVDQSASVKGWVKLFGDDFTAPEVEALAKSLSLSGARRPASTASKGLAVRAPGEQFIQEHYPVDIRYMARIDAYVLRDSGYWHPRTFRSDWKLKRGRKLRFDVHTDTPGTHKIVWKVRNRGELAQRLGQLRGGLIYKSEPRHTETTQYPGQHYVEVFILKNDVVVATDHVEVVIV
jgi:hypothetical protein